ncbi:formimidoylglutamase [Shewanella sp. WXL01]|uniref:Arginase n=1 Tax=Shewanella maritima TaxID=2520507 RepID=A0A411PJL9_9GAMM|nr:MULTISPECIES: formimidoylglutamase [Shewanella]NKF51270.1 formimidoylglutamase [Shewanella sp. WXL01]QBF83580.1 arginase [Shewanella maritima]
MLIPYTQSDIDQALCKRSGEQRLGQQVQLIDTNTELTNALSNAKTQGARFAIIGIAEDVGPQANLGRGGASNAFQAAMQQWLNLQSNRFLSGKQCLIMGEIQLTPNVKHSEVNSSEVEANQVDALRAATAELDKQVEPIIHAIFEAGLEPIIIGGGHNNALPILNAAKQHYNQGLAAINLDPHSDFRPKEGRHSGNGFSYAAASGALNHYHVLGLHELKNSEATLEQLSVFGGSWHTYQQIWVRREVGFSDALKQAVSKLNQTSSPVGVELDVDAINKMPSSASTMAGIPLSDACHYLYYLALKSPAAYCHIAEAAPSCHDAGEAAGTRDVSQALSELIYSYIQGREQAKLS